MRSVHASLRGQERSLRGQERSRELCSPWSRALWQPRQARRLLLPAWALALQQLQPRTLRRAVSALRQ